MGSKSHFNCDLNPYLVMTFLFYTLVYPVLFMHFNSFTPHLVKLLKTHAHAHTLHWAYIDPSGCGVCRAVAVLNTHTAA